MKKSLYLSSLLVLSFLFFAGKAKAQAPYFTQNPRDTALCQGLTADFMVSVSDSDTTTTFNYVWLLQQPDSSAWDTISNGGAYSGATTSTLSVLAVDTLNLYKYTCIVYAIDTITHDTAYSAPSSFAVFTVMTAPATAGTIMGSDTVCALGTGMFTDSVAGGIWASTNLTLGTISATGLFTALNSGTDMIVYSVINSCGIATTSATIYIAPSSNPGTISGANFVCYNSTTTLSETDTTGVWGSNNSGLATVDSAGIVTSVAPGMDTISYMVTDTNGCVTYAWHILTIDTTLLATPVTGPMVLCAGSNITLVDSNSSEMHEWVVSNGSATISPSGMLAGVTIGMDTVLYLDSNSCNSAIAPPFYVNIVGPLSVSPVTSPVTDVCMGSTILLSDASAGGRWMVSNTNATIADTGLLTGVMAGMDTVLYADSNACGWAFSAPFVVTVDIPLTAGVISGAMSTICVGSSVILSDPTPGGIWFSSNTAVALVDPSGYVTGRSLGTSTISYILSNACGNSIATDTIWVESPAPMPSGPDSLGVGDSIMLYDSVLGGTWSKDSTDTLITLTASGKVVGLMVGIATVTYSVTNQCGTSTVTEFVYVGAPPTVSGITATKDSVCLNGTLQLHNALPGGVWSMNNAANATINASGLVTGMVGLVFDTANYTVSNAFGNTTVSYSFFINEEPQDSINMDTVAAVGSIVPLTTVATGGGHSTGGVWLLIDTGSAAQFIYGGSTAITLVVLKPGRFQLQYISANTCGHDTAITYIETPGFFANAVSMVTETHDALKLAPNPTSGSFLLTLSTNVDATAQVTISNVLGVKVKALNINTNMDNLINLDEPAGIYFINAITPSGDKFSTKVIVK